MAAATFQQGSEEHMMFTEIWKLCRKYWEVEDNDKYWDDLVNEAREYFNKFKDFTLARELTMAFLTTQEKAYKQLKTKE